MPDVTALDPISPRRPTPLNRWWLGNRWDDLAFVHWSYKPALVQSLLPPELRVDTFDGHAWVSLVPFEMNRATPRGCPPIPWISSFVETNVRTYVVDSSGNRAVWFFSLEASRLAIVAFARAALGFPYIWSTMSIERSERRRRYTIARRRWPSRPSSETDVEIEIGEVVTEPSDLDQFLTARWGALSRWPARSGRLRHHPVDHPEWSLHSATLLRYNDRSLEAAGLPAPRGAPLVHWVETLPARFGRPSRV